jgi:hypothetical protein
MASEKDFEYVPTWHSYKKKPLYECHVIARRGKDGYHTISKDTLTNRIGEKVWNEWELLNLDCKVAIIYESIRIDSFHPNGFYHVDVMEYNFNPFS